MRYTRPQQPRLGVAVLMALVENVSHIERSYRNQIGKVRDGKLLASVRKPITETIVRFPVARPVHEYHPGLKQTANHCRM